MEITAVRPIVDITLDNYAKSDVIKKRIVSNQRGLIIAGSPGAGKTTLAQGIATYLSDAGYVVKTMEAPRELQVPDQITQYTTLDGSMANTADVLLLVRPDFVIFDELQEERGLHGLCRHAACRPRHGRGHPRKQRSGRAPALLRP